jgi:MFS family permease
MSPQPKTQNPQHDPSLEPMTSPIATTPVSRWYLFALGFLQFGVFIALLGPIFITMQLKAQQIMPHDPASVIGTVLPIGAFGALIANPLCGALSDRTRTRWGRRRPWMLGGVVVFMAGIVWAAFCGDVVSLTIAWLVVQISSNAITAAMFASFADNVPVVQRGKASSTIALAQNLSILAGIYLAVPLGSNLVLLFILPGIVAVIATLVYVFTARDELPEHKLKPFTFVNIVSSFWTNPIKNPDFGFAWWSRFLITFATFMFTTYRLLYMEDRIGLGQGAATSAVALGVLLYTIALLVSAGISGWLSDRLRRRKVFVWSSTALVAVGLVILAHSHTVGQFYVAEVVMGFAYGIYSAIDTALVVDVLPNADRPGKDLGVLNIANSLPQSLAPAVALFFLKIGSDHAQNYTAMLWAAGIICVIGAIVVLPIKRVR